MEGEISEPRVIHLRYPAVCSSCGTELAPGTQARWDRAARTATCLECLTSADPADVPASSVEPRPFDRGAAGASARERYERLHQQREARGRVCFGVRAQLAARGALASGDYAYSVGMAKERALHEYRDQERHARRDVELIYGREGWLPARARWKRERNRLEAPEKAEPIIDAWREPPRSGDRKVDSPQPWMDPTERTLEKALDEIRAADVEDFK